LTSTTEGNIFSNFEKPVWFWLVQVSELGGEFLTNRKKDKKISQLIKQLKDLGVELNYEKAS